MYQLFSVIISFLFIPFLIKKNFGLSKTLLIIAGILGVLSGVGIVAIKDSILSVFLDYSSLSSVLAVAMVTILGGLMNRYNILNKIVESMILVVQNKKAILMIIPATIGMLIVPGGALLSAPFINNLGQEMDIKPSRRAAINLVFRHISMFILPYSTSILVIAATIPDLNIGKLILINLIFVAAMSSLGYMIYIRKIDGNKSKVKEKRTLKSCLDLIAFASPIYICVVLNVLTGLPFYLTLMASVLLVYFLGDKKNFFKNIIESFNIDTVLIIIAVFIIKGIILRMDDLLSIFNNLFMGSTSLYSIMFIFMISAFFFGYITGYQSSSLIILLPMMSQLNLEGDLLYAYTYFAFAASFLGYFFSPLHLCQAFTVEHMGTTTQELYYEYKLLAPILLGVLVISFLFLVR